MKNEDFLEMLGNIDDSIIDECISSPVALKKHRYMKYVITLAAVFLLTICAVLISRLVPPELPTGFTGEEHTVSENYTQESTVFFEETTGELQYTEPFMTEEPTSVDTVTEAETTVPFIPEATTAENTMPPEETTEEQPSTESKKAFFVEVPYESLASSVTDASLDEKFVSLTELLRFCRAVIMPSVIGEMFPGLDSIFNSSALDGINTEENNSFRFILPDGSRLFIEASVNALPLTQTERENMEKACEIDGTSVMLLKGKNSENEMIFSGYFEKNGMYFRISGQGKNLSEEKFIDIIKSLL